MNKIALYLNQHLLGEVSSAKPLRKLYSTDGSILSIDPEIIAFPRVTNDIRKITRFTWQLAEKGHNVGVTVRGYGGDVTGAAIGKGIIVDTSKQLNAVIEVAAKDKLVHVQPGVALLQVEEALRWQGLTVPGAFYRGMQRISVGGAIANDSLGVNGSIADSIKRLEVVLANGDIIETGRLSRRDVNKKLGLQTFEGEIYRKLEGLLEDNDALIKKISDNAIRNNTGYKRIAEIKDKDGSIDLTPLFIGSQGTLGIISEVVLKADFLALNETHAVITTSSTKAARDLGEQLIELQPAELTVIDGDLLRRAVKHGSQFPLLGSVEQTGAVVYIRFNDFNDRQQQKKFKKMQKMLTKMNLGFVDSTNHPAEDFRAITVIGQVLQLSASDDGVALPIINGSSVPSTRCDEFEQSLKELAAKHHVDLPTEFNVQTCTYTVYPLLKLDSVSDKQKLFKLMADYAALITRCGGAFTADGAEGRVKTPAAWAVLDEDEAALYEEIRTIFDPFNTLNPGVKQKVDLRTVVAALRSSYDSTSVL